MADLRESALAAWEKDYATRRALLQGLTDDVLGRHTDNPGWNVRQTAAHIACSDAIITMCGKRLSKGRNLFPFPVPAPLFRWIGSRDNGRIVRKHRRANTAALLALLDAEHRKAAPVVNAFPADGFGRPGTIPAIGRLTLAEFIQFAATHNAEHAASVRRALA